MYSYNSDSYRYLYKLFSALALLICVFISIPAKAQLSGTYTIDASKSASTSNYQTFTSAVSDLVSGTRSDGGTANGSGISGNVIFNIADGSYNEQFTIGSISGVSKTKTITFQSASADSSKVNLYYASSSSTGNNYVIQLNGCAYVTFKQIGIARTGSANNARVIEVKGGAKRNLFLSNRIYGVETTSSYTDATAVIYSGSDNDSLNTFRNNFIKHGAYTFYYNGTSSSSREYGTVIEGNIVDSAKADVINIDYHDSLQILKNTITNCTNPFSNAGIYGNYVGKKSSIRANKIDMPKGERGIYLVQCKGTSADPIIIANNFISIGGTTASIGIDMEDGQYQKYLFNTVHMYGSNTGSSGMYVHGSSGTGFGNITILNNNFVNLKGLPVYYSTSSVIDTADYNNLYTKGFFIGQSGGTKYLSFTSWQLNTKKDVNGINEDPGFKSNTDLHIKTFRFNGAAKAVSRIKDDIDGEIRDKNKPDIGADEFYIPPHDAGVVAIDSPAAPFCPSKPKNVVVKIRNYGSDTLKSATINWSVNGVTQTAYSSTGTVKPNSESKQITLGSYSFGTTGSYDVKIYTSNPNSKSDGDSLNDTLKQTFKPSAGMEGTYTIGGTNPDFKTFADAIGALSASGPCGDVIFKIRDGVYAEQILLSSGIKTNAGSKLIFTSESGDSSRVIITALKSTSYIVSMANASYVTFDKLTFQDFYGYNPNYLIYIFGGSHNNTFTNCRIIGGKSMNSYLVYSYMQNDNNIFVNNLFKYAEFGIHYVSSANANSRGTVIKNNVIDSIRVTGIYLNYVVKPQIESNTIKNFIPNSDYGMEIRNSDSGLFILKNRILCNFSASGILISESSAATNTNRSLIANNFISGRNSGMLLIELGKTNVFYNSIYINSVTYGSNSGIYFGTNGSITKNKTNFLINNNIYTRRAIGLNISDWAYNQDVVDLSEYNNIYSPDSIIGRLGSLNYTTLAAWTAKSKKDATSISVNPRFTSETDLHINNIQLDRKGISLQDVETDIDGEIRDTGRTDIGADEFDFPNYDAELLSFVSPENYFCRDTLDLKVSIRNSGHKSIDSITITYLQDGLINTSKKYYINAKSLDTVTVNIGKIKFSDKLHQVAVYTSLPDDSFDKGITRDTIKTFYQGALSGKYTIGKSGSDYSSFIEASAELSRRGVCGAVVFEVEDGVYEGQVFIEAVKGASAKNTITFQSKSRDSSKVIMTASAATSVGYNYYTLYLNGAQFYSFRHITIQRTGTDKDGGVIEISRGSHNNIFANNRLTGIYTNTTPINRRIIYSLNTKDTNNIFEHNYIKYGSDGIYLQGASNEYENGNIIRNNIFDSVYNIAVFTYYQDALVIENNYVSETIYPGSDGVLMYNSKGAGKITGNTFYSSQMVSGINLDGFYAKDTARALIANNFISLNNGMKLAGISLINCTNTDVVHNSVLVNGSNTASRAFYGHNTSATMPKGYNRLYNNIFSSTTVAMAIEITGNAISSGLISKSDYNNLFTRGTVLGKWNTTNAGNISGWRTASKHDSNSISTDPKFLDKNDLHITKAAFINNTGLAFKSVPKDIDGEIRNSTKPDIGADEFTPVSWDVKMLSILSPTTISCGDSATVIKVIISNEGADSVSNFPVYAYMGGNVDTLLKYTYIDKLGHNQSDTITFSQKVNTYAGGNFPLTVYSAHANDGDRFNDTINVVFQIPATPEVKFSLGNITICSGEDTSISADKGSGKTLEWYNSSTSTSAFFTGATYKTPVLYSDQTYYVRAVGTHDFTVRPKTNTELSTSGLYLKTSQGIYFNALHDIVIDSVAVYPDTTGKIVIEVMNSSFKILGTVTFNNTQKKKKVYVPLNFKVPAGNMNILRLNTASTTAIYKTTGGAIYPYTVDNTVSLLYSSVSNTSKDYYFFFDWHISRLTCPGRKSVLKITVNKKPSGSALKKGSVFNGSFNSGTATSPDHVCVGNTITYDLTPPTGLINSDFGSKWSISRISVTTPKGTSANDTSFIKPSSAGNGKLTFTPKASLGDSTVLIYIQLSNGSGCDSSFTRFIEVHDKPKADFSVNNVCFGKTVSFTDNSKLVNATFYKWSFGDGNTSTSTNPTHNYASAGTYKVTLELKSSFSCIDTISKIVTVNAFPSVNISVADVCFGDSIRIKNNSTIASGNLTYKWYFGAGFISIFLLKVSVHPPLPVTVSFTLNMPSDVYLCDGFCAEELSPSPKSQL